MKHQIALPVPIRPDRPAGDNLFECRYYEGAWRTLPDLETKKPVWVRKVPVLDLELPHRGKNFACRFAGVLQVRSGGRHEMVLAAEKAARVYLGGVLVAATGAGKNSPGQNAGLLLAPGYYSLIIEYWQVRGKPRLDLALKDPDGNMRPVSGRALLGQRYGAYNRHYGYGKTQEEYPLPQGKAGIVLPKSRKKGAVRPELVPVDNGWSALRGGWEMASATAVEDAASVWLRPVRFSLPGLDTANWHQAVVPGTVLTTLVAAGVYPDPYYGLNNLAIPDTLCRDAWWYRTELPLARPDNGGRVLLEFGGVNYMAEVWLNGHNLGSVRGAFARGLFDITDHLLPGGDNALAVRVEPPYHPGHPFEPTVAQGAGLQGGGLCLDGPTFFCTEAWLWITGIRDRNTGLWQDVRVKTIGTVRLADPNFVTELSADHSRAALTVVIAAENFDAVCRRVQIAVRIEERECCQDIELAPGERREIKFAPPDFPALVFENPRLWWPNGYGRPDLYTADFTAAVDGILSARHRCQFGLRTLTYELMVNLPGNIQQRIEYDPLLVFRAGKPVLDMERRARFEGGDQPVYLPGDKLPEVALVPVVDARTFDVPSLQAGVDPGWFPIITDEKMQGYLVLRVNGRRLYVKGGNWGIDDAMKNISREKLEPYFRLHRDANFNMVRNWCGQSTEPEFFELADEYGLLVWSDLWMSSTGVNAEPRDEALFLANACDVARRYRHHASLAIWCARNEGYAPPRIGDGLAAMFAEVDGARLYLPNSTVINLRGSGPWHYIPGQEAYFTSLNTGPTTELGTPALPTADSLKEMIPAADLWPVGDTWAYHGWRFGQPEVAADLARLFGPAQGVDDFCRQAQMVNYDNYRAMFEGWLAKLFAPCSMLLLWKSHTSWPTTGRQIYSYDYETYAPFWAAKHACEELHVQMEWPDDQVAVVNTGWRERAGLEVRLEAFDASSRPIHTEESGRLRVGANTRLEVFRPHWPAGLPEVRLVRLRLVEEGRIISENWYWRWYGEKDQRNLKALQVMPRVKLSCRAQVKKEKGEVRISGAIRNPSPHIALMVKLTPRAAATGRRILPAYHDDNYFTLIGGEARNFSVAIPAAKVKGRLVVTAEGWNLGRHIIFKD